MSSSDNLNILNNPEVFENNFKKTLKYKNAGVLQINIKFPGIKNIEGKKINQINKFYDCAAKGFINYCENILYKGAAAEYSAFEAGENGNGNGTGFDFEPFGAVMTFDSDYSDKDNCLRISLDISVFSGRERGKKRAERTHTWDLNLINCRGGHWPSV
ncbi:MAG: hypothetical protein FWH10_00745 [Oscillospiraceae bacterium]|nr:hypothetical protein [Oscillospiraceae bacterium]